jgi:hypothetical protein
MRTNAASLMVRVTISSCLALAAVLPFPVTGHAADTPVPWECSQYEGEAQTRCLNAFIELHGEKIGQLEGQLQAQQGTVNQLKDQMERQSAATADLQRQFSDRPPVTPITPVPYGYPYGYSYWYPPALGLGLYLGRPWIYGAPYGFRHYWSPHHYRPWRHGR